MIQDNKLYQRHNSIVHVTHAFHIPSLLTIAATDLHILHVHSTINYILYTVTEQNVDELSLKPNKF